MEPTGSARCLYNVADREWNPLLVFIWKVLFRISFGGFIVLQFIASALLLWGLSQIFPDDNSIAIGATAVLLLVSPFVIGAFSYFVFQRFTHVEYVLDESQRWLAERRERDARQIYLRNRVRRWVVWTPLVSVTLFCLFLDKTWPPASHLIYPRAGSLLGYRITVPLDWAIILSERDSGEYSFWWRVWAFRSRDLFRGSVPFLMGRRHTIAVSSIVFNTSRPQDNIQDPWRPGEKEPIGHRSFQLGNVPLKCEEFAVGEDQQFDIRCTTPRGDRSCTFLGSRQDALSFYRIVQGIKQAK